MLPSRPPAVSWDQTADLLTNSAAKPFRILRRAVAFFWWMPRPGTEAVVPSDAAVDDDASVDGGGKKSLEQVGVGGKADRPGAWPVTPCAGAKRQESRERQTRKRWLGQGTWAACLDLAAAGGIGHLVAFYT